MPQVQFVQQTFWSKQTVFGCMKPHIPQIYIVLLNVAKQKGSFLLFFLTEEKVHQVRGEPIEHKTCRNKYTVFRQINAPGAEAQNEPL